MTGSAEASIDAISKSRTIAHMNKDHQEDLSLYLRHYNRLSAADAARAELLDMDTATMTIRSASGTHTVDIAPPMAAWADRRSRLVEMSSAARQAFGLRDPHAVTVTTWAPPKGFDCVVFGAVVFYFASLAAVAAGHVAPGTRAWDLLRAVHFPFGPKVFVWLVKVIAIPVLVIHIVEMWYLNRTRLQPAGVKRGSGIWFLWLGCTFFDGVCSFKRFDAHMEKLKAKGEKGR